MGRRRDYTTTRNVELAWLLLVALAVGVLVGLLIGLLIALPVGRIGGN
jgi:protein-S-isoprenylcysteine O-methyltransferase Ste14